MMAAIDTIIWCVAVMLYSTAASVLAVMLMRRQARTLEENLERRVDALLHRRESRIIKECHNLLEDAGDGGK